MHKILILDPPRNFDIPQISASEVIRDAGAIQIRLLLLLLLLFFFLIFDPQYSIPEGIKY